MALEEIISEIQKLPKGERKKLLKELEWLELSEKKTAERFEKAAGCWLDFDAEDFVAEIYARRLGSRKTEVEW